MILGASGIDYCANTERFYQSKISAHLLGYEVTVRVGMADYQNGLLHVAHPSRLASGTGSTNVTFAFARLSNSVPNDAVLPS